MNTVIALQESRAPQAAHHVFEQLREMILSIALPPGVPLSRAELQRKFHVSSTPVRDALMRLEEVGLVDVFPQSGHIDRIRRLHLPVRGKVGQILRDHVAIVKAIADGKPSRAQAELRAHLSQSLAYSDELRVRFPNYFGK